MELGNDLVRELGFDDDNNTLGRWMAHHLAELIDETENADTAAARKNARKLATEVILKLWEHRASLPGNAYPLAPYKDILTVLQKLRPGSNPFRPLGNDAKAKREYHAADLFDSMSRLICVLLLMESQPFRRTSRKKNASIKALNRYEKQVLVALEEWFEFVVPAETRTELNRGTMETNAKAQLTPDKVAMTFIDEMAKSLGELKADLEKNA